MKKKLTFLLLIVIILGFSVFFLNKKIKNIKDEKSLPKNEIEMVIRKIGQELENKYPQNEIKYTNEGGFWWIDKKGISIQNPNAIGANLNLDCDIPEEMGIPKNDLKIITPLIDKIFFEKGFIANELNSSSSFEDDRYFDYVRAYEKNDLKCVFTGSSDCWGKSAEGKLQVYANVFCSEDYQKNYQEQSPYLLDMDIKEAIINVQKAQGNFVRLGAHLRRTGYYIIAEKRNGKWFKIFEGQDYPPCQLMEQYKVPQEIYTECY